MTDHINTLPTGGMVYVNMPTPEQLAEDAMALHVILENLLLAHFGPRKGHNAVITTYVEPVLQFVSERARRLGNDIDRLARAG